MSTCSISHVQNSSNQHTGLESAAVRTPESLGPGCFAGSPWRILRHSFYTLACINAKPNTHLDFFMLHVMGSSQQGVSYLGWFVKMHIMEFVILLPRDLYDCPQTGPI